MLNPVGKVVYSETKLSAFAINYRKELEVPDHSGNIAVFEFIGENGKLDMEAFTTLSDEDLIKYGYHKKYHAEEFGFIWLEKQGINNDRVVRIYSELEPCMLNRHKCKQEIAKNFPNAKVSYYYTYNNHKRVMKKAIDDRAKYLKRIIKN